VKKEKGNPTLIGRNNWQPARRSQFTYYQRIRGEKGGWGWLGCCWWGGGGGVGWGLGFFVLCFVVGVVLCIFVCCYGRCLGGTLWG